jgi:hypothetical protein
VVLLRWLDGPSALIAVGVLGALGSLCFAFAGAGRRAVACSAAVLLLIGGFAVYNAVRHAQGTPPPVRILYAKGSPDPPYDFEDWNSFSRVTIYGNADLPSAAFGWGMSQTIPLTLVRQRIMTIDTGAGTVLNRYSGDPAETDYLRFDCTNLAHWAKRDADVLVVGVGGGRDILSALEFEQRSVTGVEINGDILALTNGRYGDFTGHLDRDPRVILVNDEARSFLARSERKYDLVQISLIDTWAATSSGAFALSENALYTTDAFAVFFHSLAPQGILSVTRWYQYGQQKDGVPPLETMRLVALAAQALKDHGSANPRDHILAYRAGRKPFLSTTVLISPEPFSPAARAAIESAAERMQFVPVLTPDAAILPAFERLTEPEGPAQAIAGFAEDLSPPSDERPFFFQLVRPGMFLSGRGFEREFLTRPVLVLATLGSAVIVLALGLIALPLLLTAKRTRHAGMAPFYLYFAGIGLGFLLVEISQLQRLNIFLGHPTYALTVVLFSLLLASGAGSLLGGRLVSGGRSARGVGVFVALLAILLLFALLQPLVIRALAGATTPVRILAAALMLVPLGLLMGAPFAIGMSTATATRADPPTAYFWGINGATSVCASVLGMVLAIFFGISAPYWAGAAAYAMAGLALARAIRR